jgi:hypothetical protein
MIEGGKTACELSFEASQNIRKARVVKLAREHCPLEDSQCADDLALISAQIEDCASKGREPGVDVMNTLLLDCGFLVLGLPVAETR